MTQTHFEARLLDRVRQEIGEDIRSKTGAISNGSAEDFADYRYRCGVVRGMGEALAIMEEIARKMGDER